MSTPISFLLTDHRVNLHCPVCGKLVANASPEVVVDPCPHLLFVGHDGGGFRYVSEGYRELTDEATKADEDDVMEAFEYAVEHLEPDDLLFFSVRGESFQDDYAFSSDLGEADEE